MIARLTHVFLSFLFCPLFLLLLLRCVSCVFSSLLSEGAVDLKPLEAFFDHLEKEGFVRFFGRPFSAFVVSCAVTIKSCVRPESGGLRDVPVWCCQPFYVCLNSRHDGDPMESYFYR